jgi:hypothetical protein
VVVRLDSNLLALVDAHTAKQAGQRRELIRLDRYYDGLNRLKQLQLAIPTELEQFVVFVNWCRKAVDSVENRMTFSGFRLQGETNLDEGLMETMRYNDMEIELSKSFIDMLALSVSYISIGTNEDDPEHPLVMVESPTQMTHMTDNRRRISSVFKSYDPNDYGRDQQATLYLPDSTHWLKRASDGNWREADRDDHDLGRVPIVPFVNRPRSHRLKEQVLYGTSQMSDVISIVDAAARALTNAQVAQEIMATPQRGVLGATKGDFVDESGVPLPAWEAYFGSVWAISNPEAKTFQFDSADMKNFETVVDLYARQASGVTGLPPNYFGLTSDDAASDSAIRSRETQLVKFGEKSIGNVQVGLRQVAQIVDRFKTGDWDPDLRAMEVVFQDPGTPTRGQLVDSVVKLKQDDILDRESAWEELGYSPARINILRERFEKQEAKLLAQGVDQFLDDAGANPDGSMRSGDTRESGATAVRGTPPNQ